MAGQRIKPVKKHWTRAAKAIKKKLRKPQQHTMIGTKIEEIINPQTYQLLITQDQEIRLSPHALDHLSEGQRQPKTAEELIHTLKKETPVLAGKQGNGRYAAYFKRKDHYLKIIFNKTNNIEIVTFINTQNIPRKTR